MAATITISKDYGYVLFTSLTLLPLLALSHGLVAAHLRTKAKIPYPNHYATAEQAKSNPAAYAFNCAQRAHAQFLEHFPYVLAMTLVAGVRFPRAAAGLGVLWGFFRVLYLRGYVGSGMGEQGAGRKMGTPYYVAEVGLLGLCGRMGWEVLNGGS